MYTYIHIVHTHIYIYIEREREIHVYICMYRQPSKFLISISLLAGRHETLNSKKWLAAGEYLNGLRLSMEIYGRKHEKTVVQEGLQEACFDLTQISENLRKPPGICEMLREFAGECNLESRKPVLQFPVT